MLKRQIFKVYEYPLKDHNGKTYLGSYTIKDGAKPLGFKDEVLVERFVAKVKVPLTF